MRRTARTPAGPPARTPTRTGSSGKSPTQVTRGRRPAGRDPRTAQSRNDDGIGGEQIEGRRSVLELLSAGRRKVYEVLLEEGMEASPILDEIERLAARQHVRVINTPPAKLYREARSHSHQGVIARAVPLDTYTVDDLVMKAKSVPFIVVLDGVTDPHNLGSVLRSAECAGATGVVIPRHRSARVSATAAKVASGAIEYLDFAVVGGIPAALLELDKLGVAAIGLDPSASRSLYDISIHASEPVALVLGSEEKGMSALSKKRCSVMASLPQLGKIASLNVSAAGAIALYRVAQLRSAGQSGR